MENKDQPAYPQSCSSNETGTYLATAGGAEYESVVGLSKRELIAAMALQGILAKSHVVDGMTEHEVNSIVSDAIMFAEALLTELPKY